LTQNPGQVVSVNIITGFLGSGKTTLLRSLLVDPAMDETAVLINEFDGVDRAGNNFVTGFASSVGQWSDAPW